ncbi:hypothetical protein V1512DRAFT_263820 [Lipomyces arxii]|uniref:uncharacterized protein n=1 Tax=Lipomyces arxii TaxID=56418 RepID=UPI0034CD5065
MSRAGGSRVRGPNSALTEFLRERGIDANRIRHRYEETIQQQNEVTDDAVVTVSGSTSVREADGETTAEAENIAEASSSRKKRYKKKKKYSDDEDDLLERIVRPRPGQIDFCAECQCRFTVTAYSKSALTGDGLLCHSCGSKYAKEEKKQKTAQIASRKRKKSVSAALLDKQELAVPKLQDLCTRMIAKYIDDVELLGDIGDFNMDKIARILSRNRSLKDNTVKLFLNPTIKRLNFWDCSNLCSDSFEHIASFCPSLESLTLSMCGQMTDRVFDFFAQKLKNLHSLTVDGGFLITVSCWAKFLATAGPNLQKLSIGNTLRFNTVSLQALVHSCSPTLEELAFTRVGALTVDDMQLLLQLPRLTSLEISYMRDVVTDDNMINVLRLVGSQLVTLNLYDCGELTDKFLLEGIRPYCGKLQNLSLGLGDGFTNEGMRDFFQSWDLNDGLINLNLSRCTNIGDEAVQAALNHSAKTLVILNLNSVYDLTSSTMQLLASLNCEYLSQLDVGFLKCIGDEEIEFLTNRCKSLELIEVYGNIRITELAKIRFGVKLVGRQSDSI